MDKYDPNRDLIEQKESRDNQETTSTYSDPLTPTNFYRELVEFAVFVGVTLFPIYLFFNSMTLEVQSLIAQQVEPVRNHPGETISFLVDKDFARAIVITAFLLIFTTLFFVRHSIKNKSAYTLTDSRQASLVDNDLLEEKNKEIDRLNARIQKDMMVLRTIHNQVYDDNKPRVDYSAAKGMYYVSANGDLKVHRRVTLKAAEKEVPFWVFYAIGEEFSQPLDSVEDLNFSVVAEDENTEIVYLVTEDEGLRKEIAVYFIPLLRPDETRSFQLYYEWPGSFMKLLKRGIDKYEWSHRSYSPNVTGNFHVEWVFDAALGEVHCKNTGNKPAGLELRRSEERSPCRWILQGEDVPLGNINYQLTFWTNEDEKL